MKFLTLTNHTIMNKISDSTGATVVAPSDFHDTKSEILENQQVKRHFLRMRAQARARSRKKNS